MAASNQIYTALLDGFECAEALSLGGELRPVRGALAMSLAPRQEQSEQCLILPEASAAEAALEIAAIGENPAS